MDIDSDETDKEIEDLEQLNAVLEADAESTSTLAPTKHSAPLSESSSASDATEFCKVETALALNRLTELKLVRLEKQLTERLHQSRQRTTEILSMDDMTPKKIEKFRYLICGKPYFKDANYFPAPDNSDALLMAKSGMYDFSTVSSVPGWTVKDKSEFLSSMLKMSKDIRFQELNSKMAQIRRDTVLNDSDKTKALELCKREFNAINKKTLKDLALPINSEYDWEIISNKLNRRHSPQEYRALWKLFLHPNINKECWSKAEHTLLQKLVHNNLHDWDGIAEELNTNRTGYQCFVYYRTNMSNTFTGTKWTKEEEEYLKRLIEYYREENYIPWGRIAASMENRTKIQIYNKYLRLIELRKGRFLPEEDAVILNCVSHFGPNFRKIKTFVPGRSHVQLKNRYQILSKQRLSTVWTVSEDKKLVQLMANQDTNMTYSSLCKYFPGKDRVNIRARHITLTKWLKRNPNVDLSHAPRRGARRLCHGQAVANINKAVEKLKNRMQSEYEIRKPKRITKDSPEEDIEEAIVAQLVTEQINEEHCKDALSNNGIVKISNEVSVSSCKLNATNLRKILIFLKTCLDKSQFDASTYSEIYPELSDPGQEVSLIKVKSYSKKDVVNTINVGKPPDIWGEKLLGATEYVIPPNYATITGCRVLITHITSRSLPKLDLNVLKARNVQFRDQLYLLMERFNILFMWPMLLSNEGPDARRYGYTLKKKIVLFPNINPFRAVEDDDEEN